MVNWIFRFLSMETRFQAGKYVPKLELGNEQNHVVLVPKLQLGNPVLEAPASRIQGKLKHFGFSRSKNRWARKRDGMRSQAGTAVPKLELGNERNERTSETSERAKTSIIFYVF